jgi:mRNA interferase MazF
VRGIPAEVRLTENDGMPQDCVVNLDIITTIPKDSLHTRLSVLGPGKLKEVEAAVHFALGLET